MFAILFSAFNAALGWLVRGVVIKFVILSAIAYVIAWIAEAVLSQLDISSLTNMETNFNSLGSGILYFLGVFRMDIGIPLILGAMLTAFLIRRLPIIG